MKIKNIVKVSLILLAFILVGCSNNEKKQESIDKLKGFADLNCDEDVCEFSFLNEGFAGEKSGWILRYTEESRGIRLYDQNLVEILKNCPEGTKLYSTIYGDVELIRVNQNDDVDYPIEIKLSDDSINSVTTDGRLCEYYNGECVLFPSKEQRDWSKFKPKKSKFDPKTLKPFDKVLVRDRELECWTCGIFSYIYKECLPFKYLCIGSCYTFCIPYNDDTKHLLATKDEAPEFYRYWED